MNHGNYADGFLKQFSLRQSFLFQTGLELMSGKNIKYIIILRNDSKNPFFRNTGTFRQSYTWVPYTHTGTWRTRDPYSTRSITSKISSKADPGSLITSLCLISESRRYVEVGNERREVI